MYLIVPTQHYFVGQSHYVEWGRQEEEGQKGLHYHPFVHLRITCTSIQILGARTV